MKCGLLTWKIKRGFPSARTKSTLRLGPIIPLVWWAHRYTFTEGRLMMTVFSEICGREILS